MRYACIARHQREYPVRLMCRVLDVSHAGFYAWRVREPSARAKTDAQLKPKVQAFHARSDGTYGAPRVLRDLRDEGVRVGQKRVARLMRAQGLRGCPKRMWVRTTRSNPAYPVTPNRLQRRFRLTEIPGTNRVWVSDFTYVRTHEGWLYLAIVLDLASRRCIGWAMQDTMEATLTLSALQMALRARAPGPGLLHHSDRGVQYACDEYRGLLAAHGVTASMSNKGDCWDNAVAESFFATLKGELLARRRWRTRAEARRDIFRYIEIWYNRHRRHSTLGYLSPAAYEATLASAA